MTKLNFQDGVFRVEVCEKGHVTLNVFDEDGCLKFVSVMSKDEALSLAARLRVCVADLLMHQRAKRFGRASGRRLPEVH